MKPKQTLQHDLLMRTIKIVDIGYINILNIALALFVSKCIDVVLGDFDEKKEAQKAFWRRTLELLFSFWIFGVLIYVAHNLIEIVPFPLNGYNGYDHFRVKELNSASIFPIVIALFNNYLKHKVVFYYNQL